MLGRGLGALTKSLLAAGHVSMKVMAWLLLTFFDVVNDFAGFN